MDLFQKKKQLGNAPVKSKEMRLTTANLIVILLTLFVVTFILTFYFVNKAPSGRHKANNLRAYIEVFEKN